MTLTRLGLAGLLIASAGTLTACDEDGYGYGRPAVGYGPAYYDGYAEGPYAGYPSYYGWYGSYYYPGTGFYVYDQYRRPYRWNGDQRRYWQGQQRNYYRGAPYGGVPIGSRGGYNRPAGRPTENWGGFHRPPAAAGGGRGGPDRRR